jgi:hypothetical protein
MTATHDYVLSGAMVRRLMRTNHLTIRQVATRFNLSQVRVREVRATGVRGWIAADWYFMLCGRWLDE